MERETNQTQPPTLCRAGCGFYGNSAFEGMCSKCYKESVKRKQSPPLEAGRTSPATSTSLSSASAQPHCAPSTPNMSTPSMSTPSLSVGAAGPSSLISIPSTPTKDDTDSANMEISAGSPTTLEGDSPTKSQKRNRCLTCRKKVGLTGFECRCGGIYCGIHRYSDKHDCEYDYRADARSQIAKQNPVIVGEKVKKI